MARKRYRVQTYKNASSSSDTTTSSSENSETPLKKFNRLLRSSVARHWAYFRREKHSLRDRGRSVSDAGLCSIADHDPLMTYKGVVRGMSIFRYMPTFCRIPEVYLDIPTRRRVFGTRSTSALDRFDGSVPTFSLTSAGGGNHLGVEEASDGSDAERPRRNHLRVPSPAFVGQSTGNFAAGQAGGGREVPRSAPATPLQLDLAPRTKHDKQAVKPLSGSAPSVRTGPANGTGDAKEGKQPSKSRQKKFQRHFPQVGPEEKVLNYYSCALVGDLLLQGHLYITKNYFAFYSNVFGYVTKLLIPTTSVLRITKEKVARIIPNAVGVCTRDERHVFGSLLSRDSTYKLMTHVWKAARAPELVIPSKTEDLRVSEVELDASEYSPEDDSSSAGDRLDAPDPPAIRREPEALIGTGVAAVIQPALLTGSPAVKPRPSPYLAILVCIAVMLTLSAAWLCYKLYQTRHRPLQDDLSSLSGEELYSELVRFRARLHGRAANELHTFLSSNLLLLSKVRQSLEALSGVILTDMAHESPSDSVFS